MTEINNNIHSFGYNPDNNRGRSTKESLNNSCAEAMGRPVVQDTGVYGKSQVKDLRGSDITKSVDSAVKLAKNNPVLLQACDDMYEYLYDLAKKEGLSDADAHMYAIQGEGEFIDLASSGAKI